MNELTRTRYLQALGTDTYISRSQLPGAAVTRRLTIVRQAPAQSLAQGLSQTGSSPAKPAAHAAVVPEPMPELEASPKAQARDSAAEQPVKRSEDPRFSLVAISCGGWLWLEEQKDSSRLTDQLQLVQSMANAMGLVDAAAAARALATEFEWPIHNNRQLDQGEEAARASVAGFIQRKLEPLDCQGVVLLRCGRWGAFGAGATGVLPSCANG